mmetsp:Transcript_15905/g.29096  ORF Transcript_15905/g.29096 Transcript_15905/m.29096 type:complete len:205 (+) Transcript_15905:1019-1633(+)
MRSKRAEQPVGSVPWRLRATPRSLECQTAHEICQRFGQQRAPEPRPQRTCRSWSRSFEKRWTRPHLSAKLFASRMASTSSDPIVRWLSSPRSTRLWPLWKGNHSSLLMTSLRTSVRRRASNRRPLQHRRARRQDTVWNCIRPGQQGPLCQPSLQSLRHLRWLPRLALHSSRHRPSLHQLQQQHSFPSLLHSQQCRRRRWHMCLF